ncbi:MAG: hypothetical protein QOI41_2285 [Myxococcales bacterium]|nr:hypothetical protein [Myxococcales bacterium]
MVFRRTWWIGLTLAAVWSCSANDPSANHLTGGPPGGPRPAPDSGGDSPPDVNVSPGAGGDASFEIDTGAADDAGGNPDGGNAVGCTGAKVCDDFESYAKGGAPTAPWTADVASAAMAIDDTRAFSGTKSVHITTQGGGAKALIVQTAPLLPFAGNNVYGRFMMFSNVMPTTHYHLVIANGPGDNGQMTMGGIESSKALFNYGPGDNTAVSNTQYPSGKWTCIQWQFDGPNTTARMSIDGLSLDNQITNWQSFSIAKLSIGLLNCCDDAPMVDMWIDAVAIDDKPVACP